MMCEDANSAPPLCLWCSKPTRVWQGRNQKFCSPVSGRRISPCASAYNCKHRSPEQKLAKNRANLVLRRKNPKVRDAYLESRRRHRLRHRDRLLEEGRARYRRSARPSGGLVGSVIEAASVRAPGRELLLEIHAKVPHEFSWADRQDVIAQAALLILEGTSLDDAVPAAIKAMRKGASLLRCAKPLEDCYWLI